MKQHYFVHRVFLAIFFYFILFRVCVRSEGIAAKHVTIHQLKLICFSCTPFAFTTGPGWRIFCVDKWKPKFRLPSISHYGLPPFPTLPIVKVRKDGHGRVEMMSKHWPNNHRLIGRASGRQDGFSGAATVAANGWMSTLILSVILFTEGLLSFHRPTLWPPEAIWNDRIQFVNCNNLVDFRPRRIVREGSSAVLLVLVLPQNGSRFVCRCIIDLNLDSGRMLPPPLNHVLK